MRTTLTLDPDVADKLRQEQRRRQCSFKEIVNEILRLGLSLCAKPPRKEKPFRIAARHMGLRTGIDPDRLNQLADQLETERFRETDS
ncbi:MAG: DUF2191 domain-containing protein [Deltaproteobacteria bacterium]|nr:DUF2191 domain-containing protein [Deltaproteobacteria bacterium]